MIRSTPILIIALAIAIFISPVFAATETYYPASDMTAYAAAKNVSFGEIVNTSATGSSSTITSVLITMAQWTAGTDYFQQHRRYIATVNDTGSCTPASARIKAYSISKTNGLGTTGYGIVVVNMTPAGYPIAYTDYTKVGHVLYSNIIDYATIPTANWVTFELNGAGLAALNTDGNFSFAIVNTWDSNLSFGGTWAANASNQWLMNQTASTGTEFDPYLEITCAEVPTPTPTVLPAYTDWPWCAKQDIFFWNLSDAISGYRVADHRPEINNTDYTHVEVSSGTGSVNLGSWITPRGSPGVTVIGPGLWRFRSYLNVSSAVGTTVYEYKLFNRSSDGTETDLFYGHSITADVNSLTPIEYLTSYARRNYTTLFSGDRLVIKINASTTSVAARDAWISLAGNSQASMVESGYYICTNPQASAVAQTPINPAIPFIAMALSILALAYHRRRA